MKVIFLSCNSYKDSDAILTCIDQQHFYTLIARGIYKPTSKLSILVNIPTYADIDIKQSKKTQYYSISNAQIIFSSMEMMHSYDDMIWLMILAQIVNKCLNDEEKPLIFDFFLKTLHAIKNNFNKNICILSLIAKILKISGFEIDVIGCHNCHRKDQIISFSMNEGGFICKNCYINGRLYSKKQLILLHDIFKDFYYPNFKYDISDDDFKQISQMLIDFIEDNFDIKIDNFQLLFK